MGRLSLSKRGPLVICGRRVNLLVLRDTNGTSTETI